MKKPTNLPEYIASFLTTKEHKLTISFCGHDEEKGQMTAIVALQGENGEVVLKPFAQTGDYASFNGLEKDGKTPAKYLNGSGGLWQSLTNLHTLITEADSLRSLEKELEEKKKELKAEEEKLKKAAKVKVEGNRCAGSLDGSVLQTIVSVPATDPMFKKAIDEANLQTLLKAIETLKTTKGVKSKFAKVSGELKKITGTTAEDMGHTYAPEDSEADGEAEDEAKIENIKQMSLLG